MTTRKFVLGLGWACALAAAPTLNADTRQWNPNISSGYTILQDQGIITITAANESEVYEFEAFDANDDPIDIREITVAPGLGTVMIAVIGDSGQGRTLGAANLFRLDLSGSSNSTLVQVKIGADLGQDGPTVASTLAAAGGLTPTLEIGGSLLNDIEISGNADGSIIINGSGPHSGGFNITSNAADIQSCRVGTAHHSLWRRCVAKGIRVPMIECPSPRTVGATGRRIGALVSDTGGHE